MLPCYMEIVLFNAGSALFDYKFNLQTYLGYKRLDVYDAINNNGDFEDPRS